MPIGIAKEAVRQRVERKQSSWVWKRRVNELGPRPRLSDLYCLQRVIDAKPDLLFTRL